VQPIVAGPHLLELRGDISDWLLRIRAWEAFLRTQSLTLAITSSAVAVASTHDHWPRWDMVKVQVEGGHLDVSVEDAMRVYSFMTGRLVECEEDGLVLVSSAGGCLGTDACEAVASEVRTAAILSTGPMPIVAGSNRREFETLTATVYNDTNGSATETGAVTEVACAPMPLDLLGVADILEWLDTPSLVARAIRIRLDDEGVPPSASELVLLPTFCSSLQSLPRERRLDAVRSAALLCLPLAERPRGLKERPIRVTANPNSEQLQSMRGGAYRVTLSKHGAGWRLHYWRDERAVTAALVTDHDSVEIPV